MKVWCDFDLTITDYEGRTRPEFYQLRDLEDINLTVFSMNPKEAEPFARKHNLPFVSKGKLVAAHLTVKVDVAIDDMAESNPWLGLGELISAHFEPKHEFTSIKDYLNWRRI